MPLSRREQDAEQLAARSGPCLHVFATMFLCLRPPPPPPPSVPVCLLDERKLHAVAAAGAHKRVSHRSHPGAFMMSAHAQSSAQRGSDVQKRDAANISLISSSGQRQIYVC